MPQVERSKRLRTAMLAGELADDPESVDMDTPEAPAYVKEPAAPAVIPAPSMEASIAALIAALTANSAMQAGAITDALGHATKMAREQIPENKVSPGISVYSHPEGDLKRARTVLRCPMFLGVYNESGTVSPAFEYAPETLTEIERVGLNALVPGIRKDILRNDGQRALWRVAEQNDSNGNPMRMVIAVPEPWLGKDQFAQMPRLTDALHQLIAAQAAA